MQTIELTGARNKIKILADFLDGLHHVNPTDGLKSYYAAKAARNGNLRVGVERRVRAIKAAVHAFNCTVSIANDPRGLPNVRLYSPIKQIEIFF